MIDALGLAVRITYAYEFPRPGMTNIEAAIEQAQEAIDAIRAETREEIYG